MADTLTLIAEVYAAFNQRDVDAALAFMGENVSWPKASEGGRVVGKAESVLGVLALGLPGAARARKRTGPRWRIGTRCPRS